MSNFVRIASRSSTIGIALPLSALLSMSVSHAAMASCTGTAQPFNPVSAAVTAECLNATLAGVPDVLSVTNGTTYVDNNTVGGVAAPVNNVTVSGTGYQVSNTTIQMDGHGRELDVGTGGSVINNRVITGTTGTFGRTAVTMGTATANANTGNAAPTTFTSSPSIGTTTVTVTIPNPPQTWVGQTLTFGRFVSADNDFFPGASRIITAVNGNVVTLDQPIPANFAGDPVTNSTVVYNVTSNYGNGKIINGTFYNNVVNNSGTISAQIKAAEITAATNTAGSSANSTLASLSNTAAVKGITTSVAGTYLINNTKTGKILATHDGVGVAYATEQGGNATQLDIINAGQIQATRTGTVTLATVSTGSPTARNSNFANSAAATLSQANGVNVQEEAETFSLDNKSTGVFRAIGDYSAAIVSRAGETIVVNEAGGLIEHLDSSNTYNKGYAIGANSNTGEIRSLSIDNAGTIHGDVMAVNSASFRWYLLSTETTLAPNGLNDRLVVNSQTGQEDSEIVNRSGGQIIGNFWYSNGAHSLENEEDGNIKGNIDVDQRPTSTSSNAGVGAVTVLKDEDGNNTNNTVQGGVYVYRGDKSFSFENAGTFQGNITIATAPSGMVSGLAAPDSTVVLSPHVFGGGGSSAATATGPGTIATFEGNLKVADGMSNGVGGTSSVDRTTTIAPILDGAVKNGEWYKVTNGLFGTALPTIDNGGSVFVDWTAAQIPGGLNGALVIGASVKDASQIPGMSQSGAAAINALIQNSDIDDLKELGAAVESLTDAASAAKAGNQLSPETNFATQQAAITLNNAIGQHIDTRLASVGTSPTTTSFAPAPSGLGMRPSEEGRSNLGVGTSDPNRSNLGANYDDDPYFAPRSAALWGQAFGAGLDQGRRALVEGYDAKLYGILAGYDNWLSPGVRFGIAGGYANTTIDGKGDTRQNQTGIDSYLGEAYGSVKGSGWYATGRAGLTWHNYDTTRVLTVPIKDTAKGSHEGEQYNAAIEFGAPMHMAGAILTPIASLTYSHLDQDAYTEKSNAGMALTVARQSNDSVVSGLGLKALVPIANDTVLEGRAVWLHEFSDTSQIVTASFAAGGGTFTAAGPNVGRDSAALGAGILAQVDQNMTFELNYDANVRQDFLAHIGSAKLNVNF